MMDAGELLTQAENELTTAKETLNTGRYEWTISGAQLSVSTVLKSLILFRGGHYRSNSILGLLNELSMLNEVPQDILMVARSINNDFPMPSAKVSKFVIQQAEAILKWALREMGWS